MVLGDRLPRSILASRVVLPNGIGSKYLNGSAIRQDYIEPAIKWISKDGTLRAIWIRTSGSLTLMSYGYILRR